MYRIFFVIVSILFISLTIGCDLDRQLMLETELEEAQADLRETQAVLVKTQGDLRNTRGTLEETQGTLEETQGDLEETQGDLKKTQSVLEDIQVELREAEGDFKEIQGVLRETRRDLEECEALREEGFGILEVRNDSHNRITELYIAYPPEQILWAEGNNMLDASIPSNGGVRHFGLNSGPLEYDILFVFANGQSLTAGKRIFPGEISRIRIIVKR